MGRRRERVFRLQHDGVTVACLRTADVMLMTTQGEGDAGVLLVHLVDGTTWAWPCVRADAAGIIDNWKRDLER